MIYLVTIILMWDTNAVFVSLFNMVRESRHVAHTFSWLFNLHVYSFLIIVWRTWRVKMRGLSQREKIRGLWLPQGSSGKRHVIDTASKSGLLQQNPKVFETRFGAVSLTFLLRRLIILTVYPYADDVWQITLHCTCMLRVRFCGKIPKTDSWLRKRILRFFGEIQKRIINPKNPHSRRILRIKSKSGFLRFITSAIFFGGGKDLKKVFLTTGFPCKNDTQQLPYMTVQPKCFSRAIFTVRSKTWRSKIVRFPANFTPEITPIVSSQQ